MRIYTRTGDEGETGLVGNQRVSKTNPRVEAYGSVDELNSFLGLLRCEQLTEARQAALREIQETLFDIGADLATAGGTASVTRILPGIKDMEGWIDAATQRLPPLKSFILPGGHRQAALYHILRTVSRRAERRVWSLVEREVVPIELGTYLNRLSDLFFVWAREANLDQGVEDVLWRGMGASGG